jgi:hypothetical protein
LRPASTITSSKMLRVKQSKDSFPWFQSLGTGNMCPEHAINLKPMSSVRIG